MNLNWHSWGLGANLLFFILLAAGLYLLWSETDPVAGIVVGLLAYPVAAYQDAKGKRENAAWNGMTMDEQSGAQHRAEIEKLEEKLRRQWYIVGNCEARGDMGAAGIERGKAEVLQARLTAMRRD